MMNNKREETFDNKQKVNSNLILYKRGEFG